MLYSLMLRLIPVLILAVVSAAPQESQSPAGTADRANRLKPFLRPLAMDPDSDPSGIQISFVQGQGGRLVRIDHPAKPGLGAAEHVHSFYWIVDTRTRQFAIFRSMDSAQNNERLVRFLRKHGQLVPSGGLRNIATASPSRRPRLLPRAVPSSSYVSFDASAAAHGPAVRDGNYCSGNATVAFVTHDPVFITTTRTTLTMDWGRTDTFMAFANANEACWCKSAAGYPPSANTQWYTDLCNLVRTNYGSDAVDYSLASEYHNDDFMGGLFGRTIVFASAAANVNVGFGFSYSTLFYEEGTGSYLIVGYEEESHKENCYWEGCPGSCSDPETPCPPEAEVSFDECGCPLCYTTPVFVQADGGPIEFSSAQEGVLFDIHGTGRPVKVAWPLSRGTGWLVLDRNENGVIDDGKELFGNTRTLASGAPARNGYEVLAEGDLNGDRRIDHEDPMFADLLIWEDRNVDGRSDSTELKSIGSSGILALYLDARASRRVDRWGNRFVYRARIDATSAPVVRYSYDVILSIMR